MASQRRDTDRSAVQTPRVVLFTQSRQLVARLTKLLGDAGIRPGVITRLELAREVVTRGAPDVVIVDADADSEVESSERLLAELQRIAPQVPVIALASTAKRREQLATRFRADEDRCIEYAERDELGATFLATIGRIFHGDCTGPRTSSVAAADPAEIDLLAIVAHELRTPLTAMRGQLQMAQRNIGRDAQREWVAIDRAIEQIDRLTRLTSEVLAHVRSEGALQHELPRRLDLVSLVSGVVLDHSLDEDGPDIAFARARAQIVVRAHPDKVLQIVENVLSNAVKFSPPSATIRVTVVRQGLEALVRVEDQGPGVPAADAERIFLPFQRGTTSGAVAGTGLGLAISRRLAERQGGRLWLERTSEHGSVFALALPLDASRSRTTLRVRPIVGTGSSPHHVPGGVVVTNPRAPGVRSARANAMVSAL
jgi:signal transduction histidine kinase